MANHGPMYGMSKEIHDKNEARFNLKEGQQVLEWIALSTGVDLQPPASECSSDQLVDHLKDGVMLCKLAQRLSGVDCIRYHSSPTMPFRMMENISNFIDFMKKYGVPEVSCFQTVDLYEAKQLYKVVCAFKLIKAAKNDAPVSVPSWAVKFASENPRNFSPEVLQKGQTVIGLQYGSTKGASQKGMTPYGLSRQIIPEVPK